MGIFERVARPVILAASRQDGLRRAAQRLPVTREVVHRFVPGESVADAMSSVQVLKPLLLSNLLTVFCQKL